MRKGAQHYLCSAALIPVDLLKDGEEEIIGVRALEAESPQGAVAGGRPLLSMCHHTLP